MPDLEENKTLVLNYLNLIQDGKADEATKLLAQDLEWWVAGSFPGAGYVPRDTLIKSLGSISETLLEPLQFEIEYVTAEDDRVAVAATAKARKKTGGHYQQHYHMLFVVRNGKIIMGRPYLDTLEFAQEVHGARIEYPDSRSQK